MALMVGVAVGAWAVSSDRGYTQAADPNAAPNPYRLDEGWGKLPPGRNWGATFGMSVDRTDGRSMWAFDRCEQQTFCGDSHLRRSFISIPPAR
jgi:hypothetical protein